MTRPDFLLGLPCGLRRNVLRHLIAAGVTLALTVAPAPDVRAQDAENVLVQYGFDQDSPTGPDTVRVFQNARGHVRLQETFRFSGYGAVELRDVPGDRDFPELQCAPIGAGGFKEADQSCDSKGAPHWNESCEK